MEKILKIEGMHCAHCAGAVKKALETLGAQAQVNLEEKTALVSSDIELSDDALRAVIHQKGFEVIGVARK